MFFSFPSQIFFFSLFFLPFSSPPRFRLQNNKAKNLTANNYYLTLGNSLDAWISFIGFSLCLTHSIGGRSYRGSIDEFRIYARELDLNEIWLLSTYR